MSKVIKSILESYRKAKNQNVPGCYKPAQEWVEQVEEKASVFDAFLQNSDYDGFEKTMETFFANKRLTRGLFNIPNNYIIIEYGTWKKEHPSNSEKIVTPTIGNPPTVLLGDFCLDEQEKMSLQYNHSITWGTLRFHHFAEKTVELFRTTSKPFVVEIGGGFGGFAYYLLKKQRNMTYVNFDFPEMIVISSYYLAELFPEKKILLYDGYDKSTDMNDYDIVLLPNFELPSLKDESADAFLNFRSMSEMNMEILEGYISQITRILKYNGYFFHENEGVELIVTRGGVPYRRVLCHDFPLPGNLEEIHVTKSLFYDGRYFECLYKKTKAKPTPALIIGENKFSSIMNYGKRILGESVVPT